MRLIAVAVACAVVGALMSHLGLGVAVGKVACRVLSCTKCATFWLTLIACYVLRFGCVEAVCVAAAACYCSLWAELGLVWLNQRYNELWERLTKGQG